MALSPGLLRLTVDTSTDSVLDRTGQLWDFYQKSQRTFGGDEIVVVAYRSEVPFDREVIERLVVLSDRLETLDGVARVDSLSTLPVIRVNSDGDLRLDAAAADFFVDPDAAIESIRNAAQFDRIIPRTLISDDGRTLALTAVLNAGVEDRQEVILDEIYATVEGADAMVSGVPVFRVEANRRTQVEILKFAQATSVILGIFLFALFRSVSAVFFGLSPGFVGTVLVISTMGFLGVPISIATMILPSMLIALGCAYSMHVILAVARSQVDENVFDAVRPLALPLALSGLTTVVGLVSLSVIRIQAVRDVGVYGAIGVLLITGFSLTALPAVLSLAPVKAVSGVLAKGVVHSVVSILVDFLERRRRSILLVWAVVTAAVALGISQVHVETDATTWFKHGHPVRDAYEGIRSELSGISPMNIVISSDNHASVLEPSALKAIDELSSYLQAQPEVGRAVSIADPLRQVHGGFLGDAEMPLPEGQSLAEQYMLLLEGVEIIGDVIDGDRTMANIVLRVDDNGSADIMNLAERAESWWLYNGDPAFSARATGIMFEFARAEDAIAFGQLEGLLVALGSISLILLLIFRSVRLAAIALLPNAAPLLIVFGVMGVMGIPLDAGTVLIGGLALGIAVDDTIHLMADYVSEVGAGMSGQDALKSSLERVLPAILSSTLMISAGFGAFALSDFTLTRNLGWLTSSVMILCVVADVSILGALLAGRWDSGVFGSALPRA